MMDDLITWLRAQLDEDERIARAVQDNSAPFDGQWANEDDAALRTRNGWSLAYRSDARPFAPGLLEHIARHDPARVLADVAAKRAIVDAYEAALQEYASTEREYEALIATQPKTDRDRVDIATFRERTWRMAGKCEGLAEAARNLASAYADRPGYREEWRPDTPSQRDLTR